MLVQVLMAAGIMALIGMVMASVMSDMWKQSSSLQAKQNERTFVESVKQRLSTSTLCRANLVNKTGFNPAGTRDLEVTVQEGSPPVKAGSQLNSWNLEVERLYLAGINTAVASINGHTVYSGEVHFQGSALTGTQMKYRDKSLGSIFLKVQDASQTIVDCYFAESSDNIIENACRSMGGSMVGTTCDLSTVRTNIAKEICQSLKGAWKDGACDPSSLFASAGSCPAGQSASGFAGDGSLICGKGTGGRICEFKTDSNSMSNPSAAKTCCAAGEGSTCFTISQTNAGSGGGKGGGNTVSFTKLCQCF